MGVFYICQRKVHEPVPGTNDGAFFFYQHVGAGMLGCPFMRRHTNGGTIL